MDKDIEEPSIMESICTKKREKRCGKTSGIYPSGVVHEEQNVAS